MSRRKGRKGRQNRAQQAGHVFLEINGGALDGETVKVPGFSALQYHRVRSLAAAGRVNDRVVTRFIHAFCAAIGLDAEPMRWTVEERAMFLQWLGFVPRGEWTALDDLEFAQLLGGAV